MGPSSSSSLSPRSSPHRSSSRWRIDSSACRTRQQLVQPPVQDRTVPSPVSSSAVSGSSTSVPARVLPLTHVWPPPRQPPPPLPPPHRTPLDTRRAPHNYLCYLLK